jgi:hypothetical protein
VRNESSRLLVGKGDVTFWQQPGIQLSAQFDRPILMEIVG